MQPVAIDRLPVAERFVSINGEGLRAGRLAAFVRFVGCNLACAWCDTAWATVASCTREDLSAADIVSWVGAKSVSCVTLTGGEPALQPGLPSLIEALARDGSWGEGDARIIEIETNGSVSLALLDELRRSIELECAFPTRICFTLDCKAPSSGMDSEMDFGSYRYLRPDDCVKFVVGSADDLRFAKDVIARHGLDASCAVFFSPVFGSIDPAEIVSFMEREGLTRARLQLQLHKIIWPDQERGV